VLFGDEDLDHVPISQAIQASAAVHPFFPSVEIEGRFYTDGVVTRTSNMTTAIRKGADLVFVADPFVPLISEEPGFNARHGNLWIIEQDFKTVAFTRFRRISEQVLKQNSHVSAYAFVPSNRMRRLMSQNPFVARNFHPIVCEAYRSTARRLHQMKYRLKGDLAAHRIELDLDLVNYRVEALRSARKADVRILLNGAEDQDHLKAG
jgi:NTE family protein